ncbi:YitT family protein [Algivirga pacifica]|uniref:YitT family protein n=1 Tax=Algivirga pacifica TaxID=1162670 RepID=A0ABP9D1R7_9BACT
MMTFTTKILQKWWFSYIEIFLAALVYAIGARFFLIHAELISGGVFGLAQLSSIGLERLNPAWDLNVGILMFLINLPLLVFSYFKIGKQYTAKVVYYVIVNSILVTLIPNYTITEDRILNCLLAGILMGGAMGYIFKKGGSTAGFDIIATYLLFEKNVKVQGLSLAVNSIILTISSMVFGLEIALYSLLEIFVALRVVGIVYVDHDRMSVLIVTEKGEEVKDVIIKEIGRGVTVIDGRGGYSNNQRQLLITVVSRFEIKLLSKLCTEQDPKAFIQVIKSSEVKGNFSNKKVGL